MLSEVFYTIMPNKKVLLSIESDKTDEVELQRAVDRASALLSASCSGGAVVVEYTSHATCPSRPSWTCSTPRHMGPIFDLLKRTLGDGFLENNKFLGKK
jgi:hypothetical protein